MPLPLEMRASVDLSDYRVYQALVKVLISRVIGSYAIASDERVNQDRWAVERQSAWGADEATALVITDTQQAGRQPPEVCLRPPRKKIVTRVDPAPPHSTYRWSSH